MILLILKGRTLSGRQLSEQQPKDLAIVSRAHTSRGGRLRSRNWQLPRHRWPGTGDEGQTEGAAFPRFPLLSKINILSFASRGPLVHAHGVALTSSRNTC